MLVILFRSAPKTRCWVLSGSKKLICASGASSADRPLDDRDLQASYISGVRGIYQQPHLVAAMACAPTSSFTRILADPHRNVWFDKHYLDKYRSLAAIPAFGQQAGNLQRNLERSGEFGGRSDPTVKIDRLLILTIAGILSLSLDKFRSASIYIKKNCDSASRRYANEKLKMTQIWLTLGCIFMTAGAIFYGVGAERAHNDRWQNVYRLNFFICAIASSLYLAMIFKQGYTEVNGTPMYLTKYLTWTFSTPLTLILIGYLGRANVSTIASKVGADIYMILTGFVATISPKPISYVWYLVSCGAYIGLVYLLVKKFRNLALKNYPRSRKVFDRLLAVHLTIWSAYPIVWILANTGLNVIDGTIESACYTILDVLAKVGFGLLALNSLSQLEKAEMPNSIDNAS